VISPWLMAVQALFVAGCAAACVWTCLIAWNSGARRAAERADRLQGDYERLLHQWTVSKAELEVLHEQVLNGLESVEKKRRQAAASASRAARLNGDGEADRVQEVDPDDELRARARAAGLI
jgi:hypothetical protein